MRRVVLLGVIGGCACSSRPRLGAAASEIVNQSGRPDSQVFVNVAGVDYDVPGMSNDTPVALSTIPNSTVTINQLVSGRIYILRTGGAAVGAVRLSDALRLGGADRDSLLQRCRQPDRGRSVRDRHAARHLQRRRSKLEADRLGQLEHDLRCAADNPGRPAATVRSGGHIIRVLSPNKSSPYPPLRQYVQSMNGAAGDVCGPLLRRPVSLDELRTAASSRPMARSRWWTRRNLARAAPAKIAVDGSQLINDIYTGGNTPNTCGVDLPRSAGPLQRRLWAAATATTRSPPRKPDHPTQEAVPERLQRSRVPRCVRRSGSLCRPASSTRRLSIATPTPTATPTATLRRR